MRTQPPFRFQLCCTRRIIACATLLMLLHPPVAQAQTDSREQTRDFEPPELLYLTWQEENPRDPEGKYFPVWKPDGKPSRLDISKPFENPQQITNLFIVRQRHDVKKYKDLPLKRDALFKVLKTEPEDE